MLEETPNKALESLVKAMGGSKQVAPKIWPDKGIHEAQKLLCDCLSDDRPAKLDFSQTLFLLRMARDKGLHDGINYVLEYLSYARTTPIEPKDEAAELMRQIIETQKALSARVDRLASLQPEKKAAA